MFSSELCLEN